jgi:HD-GYP domain-containing protein (c-di-GMP phosphodiesterase class II)
VRLTGVSGAVGLRLARDLPAGAGGVPLLQRGATITERYARALAEHGFRAVWVDDELSAGVEPLELLGEPERADAARRVRAFRETARAAAAASRPLQSAALADMTQLAAELADRVAAGPEGGLVLHDIAPAAPYVHRHAVNVAATGLLVAQAVFRRHGWVDFAGARRFEQTGERLRLLSLALLVMDVGTVRLPADLLAKPGPLDDRERGLVRTHPEAGAALLSSPAISPRVVDVVRDHHERLDGSGYPRGIGAADIHQFAAIAAVADVYAAVTSERPYRPALPPDAGVAAIAEGRGSLFDAEVADVFGPVVLPHPPGFDVVLPDGRRGVVAAVDPYEPHRLTVRVAEAGAPVEVTVDTRDAAPRGSR